MRRLLAMAFAALLPACGGGSSRPSAMPDFSLQDVNANSASNGMNVSPRDYLGYVSGYYFGHAT